MVVKGLCYKVIEYFKKEEIILDEKYFNSIMDIIYEKHKDDRAYEKWEQDVSTIVKRIKDNRALFDKYVEDAWQNGAFYIFSIYKKIWGKDIYEQMFQKHKNDEEYAWLLFFLN